MWLAACMRVEERVWNEVRAELDLLVQAGILVGFVLPPGSLDAEITLSEAAADLIRAGRPAHLDPSFLDAWGRGGPDAARRWLQAAAHGSARREDRSASTARGSRRRGEEGQADAGDEARQ